MEKKDIPQLIASNQTREAIDQLLAQYRRGKLFCYFSAVLLSSRYQRLQQQKAQGTISEADYGLEANRINEAILKLTHNCQSPQRTWLRITLAVGLILLLAGVGSFFLRPSNYECGNTSCSSCDECYQLGCFESASECFDKKSLLSDDDKVKQQNSRQIILADNFWANADLYNALQHYEQLTDSFAIQLRRRQIEISRRTLQADNLWQNGRFSDALAMYEESESSLFRKDEKSHNNSNNSSPDPPKPIPVNPPSGFLLDRQKQVEIAKGVVEAEQKADQGEYEEAYQVLIKLQEEIQNTPAEELEFSERSKGEDLRSKILQKIDSLQSSYQTHSSWAGLWTQAQSGKQGPIGGTIHLDFSSGNGLSGTYENIYVIGNSHPAEMKELRFLENGQILEGVWENKISGQKGKFHLQLSEDKNRFAGHYTFENDDTGKYYWRGKRK